MTDVHVPDVPERDVPVRAVPVGDVPVRDIEVRLLGPVEVWSGGVAVEPGPVRQRTVLAALAVDAGRLVPQGTLVDRVWGDDPPPGVRSGIYSYMTRLRRVLHPLGAQLLARPGGYLLDVDPGSVDLHQFRRLIESARLGPARPADAGPLEAALALWRGPALADLAGDWVEATRDGLEQQRVDAVLAWAPAALAAGPPEAVITVLRDLLAQHPLVEPLAARLIEALQAAGRSAEALDCYARFRAHLADELGTEPGLELRRLHQAVLRGDQPPDPASRPVVVATAGGPPSAGPAPAGSASAGSASAGSASPGPPSPEQAIPAPERAIPAGVAGTLPADPGAFTGRDSELRQIADAGGGQVLVIHAIAGMPGVGKTALAVHVAHRLAGRFPDGQMFVDLHGYTDGREPAEAADVLATLLSADGADPGQLPDGTDARAALWRERLAGRRLLLVLDNAASSAQVVPLLPASSGCLVLVTSRRFLGDLPGDAVPVQLDVLFPAEARQMFLRLAPHAGTEPDRVAELVAACGYLPLAIGLLARVLARHRRWTVSDLLAETRTRLLSVTAEHASVEAAFGLSYQHLDAGRQRFFRLLAVHPGTVIEPYAAAALAGLPVADAAGHLDSLHADSLLIEVGYHRYVLHDLIRWYAGTLAGAGPAGERAAALGRLLDFYQYAAAQAGTRLARLARPTSPETTISMAASPRIGGLAAGGLAGPAHGLPDLASDGQALAWLRAERDSLLACLTGASDPRRVIRLTAALTELLRRDGPWTEAIAWHAAAAQAAAGLGDRLEQANALTDLGTVRRLAGDYAGAGRELRQALDLYRALGSQLGQANALTDLGKALSRTGDYTGAVAAVQQALDFYRELGDPRGEARALVEQAVPMGMTGDYQGALAALEQAQDRYRELGDQLGQAYALRLSGIAWCRTGDYPAALAALEFALEVYTQHGDRAGEALTLTEIGQVAADTGDYPTAARSLRRALVSLRARRHRIGQAVALVYLGTAARRAGDVPVAWESLTEALSLFRDLGNCSGEPAALNEMGALHRLCGELDQAVSCHRQALELAQQADSAWDEAHARAGLARCHLAGGRRQDAAGQLHQALVIFRRVGAAQSAEAAEVAAELSALS